MSTKGNMMRKLLAGIAGTVITLTGLTACGSTDEASRICVEKDGHKRVSDDKCDNNDTANTQFIFWYIISSQTVPKVGSAATDGEEKLPSGYTVDEDVPEEGIQPGVNEDEEEPGVNNAPEEEPIEEPPPPAPVEE